MKQGEGGSWTCTADVKKQNLILSIIFPFLIFLQELFTRSYRWNASEQTVSGKVGEREGTDDLQNQIINQNNEAWTASGSL